MSTPKQRTAVCAPGDDPAYEQLIAAATLARDYMRRMDEFAQSQGMTGRGQLQTAWDHLDALCSAAEALARAEADRGSREPSC